MTSGFPSPVARGESRRSRSVTPSSGSPRAKVTPCAFAIRPAFLSAWITDCSAEPSVPPAVFPFLSPRSSRSERVSATTLTPSSGVCEGRPSPGAEDALYFEKTWSVANVASLLPSWSTTYTA